jgi:superfamily II DNA or RNA helicase
VTEIELRPYQVTSVEALRDGIRRGLRRQILMAPAGSGKTKVAAFMTKVAEAKGSRVAFIVDRIVLCDQTSQRFDRYGIPHGVLQSGHWRYRPHERIQVCSAQTLEKRGFPGSLDLLFVDEAHCLRAQTNELIKHTDAVVIGLTATPFAKGMSELYQAVVNVTTTNRLIEEGFLVPLKVYAAKAADMTGAKLIAGEWAESEIETRGTEIIGDIVAEWQDKTQQHFGGPVKTIVFSATVAHGEEICRQFQSAGFNFVQISYKSGSNEARQEIIDEFKRADSSIHGLVSCEIFTKGFDVPDILCGISARPYRKSLSSHIQQLGRVQRPAEGKSFGLWLDHSGNYIRFKADTDEIFESGLQSLHDGSLDKKARAEPEKKDKEATICSCGYVLASYMDRCPGCGKERIRQNLIETLPGVMVEVDALVAHLPPWMHDKRAVWQQLCGYADQKHPLDAERARRLVAAKFNAWYGHFPTWRFETNPSWSPSMDLQRRIQHDNIKWAKSQQKRRAA